MYYRYATYPQNPNTVFSAYDCSRITSNVFLAVNAISDNFLILSGAFYTNYAVNPSGL
jgi:hypothetical protein